MRAAAHPVAARGGPALEDRRRRPARLLTEALLSLAAAGGVLCLTAVALALVLHVEVEVFRTGSMSPTIPAGSAALVREVPASSVRVGDVVTVGTEGVLPVTHRAVSVRRLGGDRALLVLRGDANPGPDPRPYDATRVRRVVASLPRVGGWIARIGGPLWVPAATTAVAALATVTSWPRERRGRCSRAAWSDPRPAGQR